MERIINTVTVIGANGTMGANVSAIFAAFGNAKVYMISRDIEKSKKAVLKAAKSVRADSIAKNLIPVDYSMLADCVAQSDLVFESIAEKLELKLELTRKIAVALRPDAIACTGTSGLSITTLSECFPESKRCAYFGVHMFNPPYNMTLCELITTKYTDVKIQDELKAYLKNVLFRSVVETKDAPAFLANRIGFQFINEAMQYAEKYKDNGGVDYIDAILGSFTGRIMAPLITADFVGMDVHKAIVDNVYENTADYARDTFVLPVFAQKLIDSGKLGRKVGEGLYKMEVSSNGAKRLMVYDISIGLYRDKMQYVFPFAQGMKASIREGNYAKALEILVNNRSREADICLHFLLNYIIYSLVTAENVAYKIHAADIAMATGFNWCPPLAMMEAFSMVADMKTLMRERLSEDILTKVDIDALLCAREKSKFDYRPYFKSTR